MIFSGKSLIWTVGGAVIGFVFYSLLKMIGLSVLGIIFLALFALVGFIIGTCKMPMIDSIKICRQTAGENLDDVIRRGIKFKLKKNRIYVYAKEEINNDNK